MGKNFQGLNVNVGIIIYNFAELHVNLKVWSHG